MHTGARRSADPAVVTAAAPAKTAARAAPAPAEHSGNTAPALPVSPGATARGDALGGTLARAVAQRSHDAGVARHDVGATLQRSIATKASHLDKHISTFGKASEATRAFVAIRGALSAYHSAAKRGSDLKTQASQLEDLEKLCEDFVMQHKADKRRKIVDGLSGEVTEERKAVSQLQAQLRYQRNVEGDPQGDPFALQALSQHGRRGAVDHTVAYAEPKRRPGEPMREQRIETAQKKHGLTAAEISAITIFSAGDFSYINPSAVNSSSWLEANKANAKDDWGQLDDNTIKQEGSLHAAVAMQGLLKLPRYEGWTYRGARFTRQEFESKGYAPGKPIAFGALTSSAKEEDAALTFLYGLTTYLDPAKNVAVLYTFTDSDGRDISDIVLAREEAEVLQMPGTLFEVTSVRQLDAEAQNALHPDHVDLANGKGKPLPTIWWDVRARLSTKPMRPTKAVPAPASPRATPWAGARSAPAADPFALPQKVGLLGQGHRSA
jgi:hypothetical protein